MGSHIGSSKHLPRVFAAFAGGFCVAHIAAAQGVADRYYVTPIELTGISPAGLSVWGINDYGQVTGGSNSLNVKPFVWTPARQNGVAPAGTTSLLNLPTRPGGPFGPGLPYVRGTGWSINNYGQVAGYAESESLALVWTPTSRNGTEFGYVTLPGSSGLAAAEAAYQINDLGQVVGRSGSLWSPATPNGGSFSYTRVSQFDTISINDRGDVGGLGSAAGNTVGGFWSPSVPNGTTGTSIPARGSRDLSNTGLGVGGFQNRGWVQRFTSGPNPSEVLIYDGGVDDRHGMFYGVNDAGVAVTGNGFAWTESGGFANLMLRLETHSGAALFSFSARSINTLGQIIGRGDVDDDGDPATALVNRPVLLTPLHDGDANVDQRVNFDDLLVLAANYNRPADSWLDADFTGDGLVNFDDLLGLAANYNTGAAGSAAGDWAMARAAVPEPASLLVAAVVPALWLARRRRR